MRHLRFFIGDPLLYAFTNHSLLTYTDIVWVHTVVILNTDYWIILFFLLLDGWAQMKQVYTCSKNMISTFRVTVMMTKYKYGIFENQMIRYLFSVLT